MAGTYESIRARKKLGTSVISEKSEIGEVEGITEHIEAGQAEEEPAEILEEKISVPVRSKYAQIHQRKKRGVGFVEFTGATGSDHKVGAKFAINEAESIIKEFWENHKEAIETLGRAKLSFESGNFKEALNHANSAKLLASHSKKAFAS